MGHPMDKHFKQIVSQRSLKNLPFSTTDIANAKALLGTSVSGLKGWTTRKKVRGSTVERVSIPEEFYQKNKFVETAADVMFVSGVAFFVREFLKNIEEDGTMMDGNCNAWSVLPKKKGWYKNFQVWLNEQGIVNLLSIPMLEEAGYEVTTHTDDEWKVITPWGEVIVFARDTGMCNRMPYIDHVSC